MKSTRTLLTLTLAGTVTFTMGLWIYSIKAEIQPYMYLVSAGVFITVIFSIVVGFKRLKDEKQGLKADDELSERIKDKAGARAFAGSIYLWTLILIFSSNGKWDSELAIGSGIIAMGIIFIFTWTHLNKQGISNENPH